MFPVEEKIGEIAAALARNRDVVLTAPPGSGKTTCVPPALLDAPWLRGRKIVMLEPRRIAARNCATYISRKIGEPVGGTVGYQVRLERKVSARTRLEVVTEGLLTNRLLADPELSDVGLVIFDEFHERSLQCDLAFALALEVRRALRPDLRILVMSATLDADEVAAHLGDADTVRAEGRMFPVETAYLGDMSMSAAISKALKENEGDILCFLPGEAEIRRVKEFCASLASGKDSASPLVLPLYGSLPKEEQDRVFEKSAEGHFGDVHRGDVGDDRGHHVRHRLGADARAAVFAVHGDVGTCYAAPDAGPGRAEAGPRGTCEGGCLLQALDGRRTAVSSEEDDAGDPRDGPLFARPDKRGVGGLRAGRPAVDDGAGGGAVGSGCRSPQNARGLG